MFQQSQAFADLQHEVSLQEKPMYRQAIQVYDIATPSNLHRALDKREYSLIIEAEFFLFLIENICCDPSSCLDSSDEGPQHMFLCRINKIYPELSPNTPSHLEPIVVVVLLFYLHGKHLRSCRDGQLTEPHFSLAGLDLLSH